ncbi:non-specific DNA-binding protein Dps / Iron-binding ferritin-like antioxidant protein / Ferroxidase [Porphyromonas crevioricanis JCM 15906]|uniref:Non-specific DNA-binding protein Dps / Iron-binding ferritin-like antioxidant protein / Ferroxidase n=2 Tax=Porphyromonas crevioricanis TaxID=393921 RepID=T1DR93_9PORP|nr:non-specific DNA-binding protein Dps / Iron-binding ferritin-like antioxidant protein / Ferroxidase [Porphyromonas crevioricanis JCM 15906]SJZ84897.1 starvation-inducible DNA-binding protein [Porphyromonas crevioricanis]
MIMNKNILSITGLNPNGLKETVVGLETLLASYQVYYNNLRGYHWHVRGPLFYELHAQFEKWYDATAEKIDEIAERLLQLEVSPENRMSILIGQSKIKETSKMTDPAQILPEILDNYKLLMALERETLRAAAEAGDEVTVALMGNFLAEQEKEIWMLTAYLN